MSRADIRTRPRAPNRSPSSPPKFRRKEQLLPAPRQKTSRDVPKSGSVLVLILAILLPLLAVSPDQPKPQSPGLALQPPLATSPDRSPALATLSFEANNGQAPAEASFVARSGALTTYLTERGIVTVAATPKALESEEDDFKAEDNKQFSLAVMRVDFVGARSHPVIEGVGLKENRTNYFIGRDETKWITGVPNYSKARYRDVYPGIDTIFYDDGRGRLEYDFVVMPGSDPSGITLGFEKEAHLEIDRDSNLIVGIGGERFVQQRPHIYQQDGAGGYEVIDGRYVIEGNTVGFEIGHYDTTRTLVIDPVMVYSSYLGGTGGDSAKAVTVDNAGNTYVAGETYSLDFPTLGPYQDELACVLWCTWPEVGSDAFLTKVSPDGSSIIYSTYIGAPDTNEAGESVGVDSSGSAIVSTNTVSDDFPILNAHQPTKGAGIRAGTISAFSPEGSSLAYSTYFGGNQSALWITDISVDDSGQTYLGGVTGNGLTTTIGAFQPLCSDACSLGTEDGFAAKLNSSGTPVYSSYIGGGCSESVMAVTADGLGNLFIAGWTCSPNFPVLNAFQPAGVYPPRWEGFVSKINPTGTALIYSSYLSGYEEDRAYGVAVDQEGHAYVTGKTKSLDFPAVNALQKTRGGLTDAFLTKVSPSGSSLIYSTYFGGTGGTAGGGVVVDDDGYATIAGSTSSRDLPVANRLYIYGGGITDAFITKFNMAGNGLVYSTHLGGSQIEGVSGPVMDSSGDIVLAGTTDSPDFPVVNAFQPACGGCDPDPMQTIKSAYVAKISQPEPNPAITGSTTNSTWGSVSIYHAVTGTVAAYQCCNTTDSWAVEMTPSRCDAGGGYKVLILAQEGYQSRWYNDKANWSEADCVDSPQSGVDSSLLASNQLTGYVKDSDTAADIDGAYLYFFTSTGKYSGYTKSGTAGAGRYQIFLNPAESYKVLVKGPATHEDIWYSSSQGFSEASPVSPPQTLNFSLRPAAQVAGWVTQNGSLLPGAYVSAYTSCGCQSPKNAITDASGNYSIKVVSSASSGYQYRIRARPPTGQTRWYSVASSIFDADDVTAPSTNVNIETPP